MCRAWWCSRFGRGWRAALVCAAGLLALSGGAQAESAARGAHPLTADEIVSRNVTARGGLEAWKKMQTMTVYGHIDQGAGKITRFVSQMKRGNKRRVDFNVGPGYLTQVFDGHEGWTMLSSRGRSRVDPFSEADLRTAIVHQDLDGPLIGYADKGYSVALEGEESLAGRQAYRLRLTQGAYVRHVWVDAKSFLEVKIEEFPRVVDDKQRQVNTYYRDYKRVGGVMVPYTEDLVAEGTAHRQKRVVDHIDFNTTLADAAFAKPPAASGRSFVSARAKSTPGSLAGVRREGGVSGAVPSSGATPMFPRHASGRSLPSWLSTSGTGAAVRSDPAPSTAVGQASQ
jgi:hypothetical protein